MENNVVLKEKFDVILSDEEIDLLIKFDEFEKRIKVMMDAKKEAIEQFIIDNNLTNDGYEDEKIKISYTKPYVRHDIDKEKLKAEGLYDMYLKDTNVKGSVKIKVKYED